MPLDSITMLAAGDNGVLISIPTSLGAAFTVTKHERTRPTSLVFQYSRGGIFLSDRTEPWQPPIGVQAYPVETANAFLAIPTSQLTVRVIAQIHENTGWKYVDTVEQVSVLNGVLLRIMDADNIDTEIMVSFVNNVPRLRNAAMLREAKPTVIITSKLGQGFHFSGWQVRGDMARIGLEYSFGNGWSASMNPLQVGKEASPTWPLIPQNPIIGTGLPGAYLQIRAIGMFSDAGGGTEYMDRTGIASFDDRIEVGFFAHHDEGDADFVARFIYSASA